MSNRKAGTKMNVTVKAVKWQYGWELLIDENNATQVAHLKNATQQVRDYLDTVDESVNHSDWNITIIPDLGSISDEITAVREATRKAAAAQEVAAQETRMLTAKLRAQGYSYSDLAVIFGVSKTRISQLASQ